MLTKMFTVSRNKYCSWQIVLQPRNLKAMVYMSAPRPVFGEDRSLYRVGYMTYFIKK